MAPKAGGWRVRSALALTPRMPLTWIEHNGTKILYSDYRGLNLDKMLALLDETAAVMSKVTGKVPTLSNFEGVGVPPEFMKKAKELGKTTFEPKTSKSAITGIDGLKALLLKAYNTFTGATMKPFPNEGEAKAYLTAK
jgi:hypothetical protein